MKTLGDLLVGARVSDSSTKYNGTPITWRIIGKNHEGDPENSVTLISEYVLCAKAFGAKEPLNTDTDIRSYGNARYEYSNILQWLNSDADAWQWYAPMHEADHPPDTTNYVSANPYESEAGFLNGFSTSFKANMLEAENVSGYNGTFYNVKRRVHLLSQNEVGLGNYDGGGDIYVRQTEGTTYKDFFYDSISRTAYLIDGKTQSDWELRTTKGLYSAVYLNTEGNRVYTNRANIGTFGIRPKIFLPITTMISDKPDENGVYTPYFKDTIPDTPTGGEGEIEDDGTPPDGMWRAPKTDWTEDDRLNLSDYNRIRNNLIYLKKRMSGIWGEFDLQDMGNDHNSVKYIYRAWVFNAVEENLEILNIHSIITKNYGYKQTFYPNGVFIGYLELNRIESATLKIKQIMEGWEAGMRRIPFRLGAPKGILL